MKHIWQQAMTKAGKPFRHKHQFHYNIVTDLKQECTVCGAERCKFCDKGQVLADGECPGPKTSRV